MARERVIDFLPEIYGRFLPEFFDRPVAEERHATCAQCAMCPPPNAPLPPDAYFSPSTKCCTYHPALPNYSVGGLLRDDTPAGAEGRRRILQKIANRRGVTPAGILPPPKLLLLRSHGAQAFGRATSLVCPYLDQEKGACTVWAHREGECATWFCKHNQGFDGRAFWRSVRDYLQSLHVVLSTYVLRELGFDPDRIVEGFGSSIDALDARNMDDRPPTDQEYAAVWGDWVGREVELFTTAFDMVSALDREAFSKLVGVRHDLTVDCLAKRHDAIVKPQLPDPLMRNPTMRVDRTPDGGYLLTVGDTGEPTSLRRDIYRVLDYFDGRRPTSDVKTLIRNETGFGVADSFLTALYHYRILVGPQPYE